MGDVKQIDSPYFQQIAKRKLSMNGWDTKEGIRKIPKVKNTKQKLNRKTNDKSALSSGLAGQYLRNLLPFTGAGSVYRLVSWM